MSQDETDFEHEATAAPHGTGAEEAAAFPPMPLVLPAAPLGVDLYHGDGPVNYAELRKGGRSFCLHKATQGTDITDEAFVTAWVQMKAAGLVRGATHFWRPSQDAIAQADYFLGVLRQALAAAGDTTMEGTVLALDVESQPANRDPLDGKTPEECAEWCRAFVSHVAEVTGYFVAVYTSQQFFADHMKGVQLGVSTQGGPGRGSPLWAVQHKKGNAPECPAEWGDGQWLIRQYAFDNRETHGATQCDLDAWNVLVRGASGNMVRFCQQQLNVTETGTFDDATDAAVRRFQQSKGLVPDGRIGPVTWSHLSWA